MLPSSKRLLRDLHGVLLFDKPVGLSSNGALQRVRSLLGARKAGHTGSLDPLASGLLPLCFGEATKFSSHLLDSDKRYVVRLRLGVATDTLDRDGRVTQTAAVPWLSEDRIEAALASQRGLIQQVPPMYSALKHEGKRLYELARKGVDVARPARPIRIHSLVLLRVEDSLLELDVQCSKGTYIRSLAVDLARQLETVGHVEALRRTEVGGRGLDRAVSLDSLEALAPEARECRLLPVDALVDHLPRIDLDEVTAEKAGHGQPLEADVPATAEWVRLYGEAGFLGVGQVLEPGRVAPRRMLRQSSVD